MLKKLAGGEYSLKITFWAFGLLGFLLFNILTNITHSGVLRIICPYGRLCSVNIVLYIFNNSVRLMTGSNDSVMTYLVCHLILAASFVCYMVVVLRGLWKSADAYEGKKFWPFCAKFLTVCLVLISLKSIF